ncbi:hypothetical protein MMC25_005663 [Agyrium rufum]|nr:hypothetical protein [Agyrium rufum]
MAPSQTPDLTLPPKSPTESYKDEKHNGDQHAVYTLVDLAPNGVNDFVAALEHVDRNLQGTASLAPKHDFQDKTLKDVYDYHLQLRSDKKYHPTIFIVAYVEDYKSDGVLLVNLNTDLECTVDTCRIRCTEALSAAVNLAIANMDWEDFKEDELPLPSFKDKDNKAPTSHPMFGVYGVTAGANMTTIRGLLEADWQDKKPEAWLCESVCSYTKYPEPLKEVIERHPWNCHRNPGLHRQWCICVDSLKPEEEGVLLVHINWDGNVKRDPNELLKMSVKRDYTTERCSTDSVLATLTARTVGKLSDS